MARLGEQKLCGTPESETAGDGDAENLLLVTWIRLG